jgi:hypothetical protein
MDLPNAEQKLKDRPYIQPKPEDVVIESPDYIDYKDGGIEEIPVEIRINEIKGSIEWK